MIFARILLLLFTTTTAVVSSTILPRDYAVVLSDLKQVDTDAKTETTDVNNYSGQLSQGTVISNDESKLESDLKTATSDVQNAGTITAAQSSTLANYANSTLAPDLSALCTAIIKKKQQLQSSGVFTSNTLANLKAAIDKLYMALGAKVSASSQSQVKSAQARINNACDPNTVGNPP